MKKAFTLIEFLVVITIVFSLVVTGCIVVKGGMGDYTAQELLMPEETKAKYQREMVEELRRANDLKEKENYETFREN
jgi:prepilin-type N-terminal cleavage/methylation domain-containing protein